MTGTYNVEDDDDEFVVIQGSALHEHMSSLGYTDFETLVVHKHQEEETDGFIRKGLPSYVKTVCEKLYSAFSWIMKAEDVSKQQLCIISNAKVLLDDHAHIIQNYFEQFHSSPWRERAHNLLLTSTVILSSTYALLDKRRSIVNIMFLSSSLLIIAYVKYKRLCARRNLETLISLQNEAFDLCKRGLKILRYGYRIPLNRKKRNSQFYALTANRLKYFQPITESVIKCMESMSHIYYKVSLLLTKVLPKEILGSDSFTRFQNESFSLHGEITYQELKELYHIYILTQSEMLHLLSIAYNLDTWTKSHCCLPEEKLSLITYNIVKYLKIHRDNLSIAIESYCSFRVEQTVPTQTGTIDKKWQDLYIHLHLTSNKLQTAYNHILSILQDIDSDAKDTTGEESVEVMMQKLNQAYQEIDGARNFAEFSSLLVARTRINNCTENAPEVNALPQAAKSEPTVILDSEPQIVDEVFEEYIREEYLKPLCQEGVGSLLEDYKWDKFLAKSFLLELKDALVDKKKSMSERESKALQRMYQNIMRDMDLKGNTNNLPPTLPRIPTPPPFPNDDQSLLENVDTRNKQVSMEANSSIVSPNRQIRTAETLQENFNEESRMISFIPLPKIETQMQMPHSPRSFPPPFLKTEEETFIGSGENSEEEQSNDEGEESEEIAKS